MVKIGAPTSSPGREWKCPKCGTRYSQEDGTAFYQPQGAAECGCQKMPSEIRSKRSQRSQRLQESLGARESPGSRECPPPRGMLQIGDRTEPQVPQVPQVPQLAFFQILTPKLISEILTELTVVQSGLRLALDPGLGALGSLPGLETLPGPLPGFALPKNLRQMLQISWEASRKIQELISPLSHFPTDEDDDRGSETQIHPNSLALLLDSVVAAIRADPSAAEHRRHDDDYIKALALATLYEP